METKHSKAIPLRKPTQHILLQVAFPASNKPPQTYGLAPPPERTHCQTSQQCRKKTANQPINQQRRQTNQATKPTFNLSHLNRTEPNKSAPDAPKFFKSRGDSNASLSTRQASQNNNDNKHENQVRLFGCDDDRALLGARPT